MPRLLINAVTAFAFAVWVAFATQAQDATESATPSAATESQVKEMIGKLSSASFSERQQASKNLLNVGPEFVRVLEDAAASSTGETQLRLRMLLPQLRERLFDDQLSAFLKQNSVENARRLPQWDRFESLCGHDEAALNIFGQILKAESRLFATRLFAVHELPQLLEVRTAEIAEKCNGRLDEEFPVASVAAVMLLGSESETRLVRATSANISSALDDPRFSTLIREGVHSRALRVLVEAWILRKGIAAERPLLFSMQHELAAGRLLALRVINSNSRRPDMILALLCLAKFRNTEDLAVVETLLSHETVLWPQRGRIIKRLVPGATPADTNYKVQTRDVALVAAAQIRGIPPIELGIAARPSDVTLFAIDSIGFSSDEARRSALAAYRKLATK
ncbi:MAG: hypothetical protein R3C17_09055 [Planctomycetaceae bacterium]